MSEFYTVSQYAEKYGKDPGNIRRMLIKGTLSGEKAGREWLIPKDTKFPEDRRLKNGNYTKWRQRVSINSKHPELLAKLNEMCRAIGEVYADSAMEIVMYGSYARGQETDESDIDMALVLKETQTQEQYDRMTELVVDYELDLGVTLSVVPIKQQEFAQWKNVIPFYKNLAKEGIVLWKNK